MHQSAALLACVPSLVFGDPSSRSALYRSLLVTSWPPDEQLAGAYMGALEPLAPHLGCLALSAPLSASLISEMGRVLGKHTHTLCLTYVSLRMTGVLCYDAQDHGQGVRTVWGSLLSALPRLSVLDLGLGGSYDKRMILLQQVASACEAAGRQIELQVPKEMVNEAQAAIFTRGRVRVVCV